MAELASTLWRLRAEEYRTIGEGLATDDCRRTYEALAKDCDRLAERPTVLTRRLSSVQCLAFAQQCRETAHQFREREARRRLRDIAREWERLADALPRD